MTETIITTVPLSDYPAQSDVTGVPAYFTYNGSSEEHKGLVIRADKDKTWVLIQLDDSSRVVFGHEGTWKYRYGDETGEIRTTR